MGPWAHTTPLLSHIHAASLFCEKMSSVSHGQLCFLARACLTCIFCSLSHPLLSVIFHCHSYNNPDSLIFKGSKEVTSTVTVGLFTPQFKSLSQMTPCEEIISMECHLNFSLCVCVQNLTFGSVLYVKNHIQSTLSFPKRTRAMVIEC